MNIEVTMTDEMILEIIGRRIAENRLTCNFSQNDVAVQAGVSKSTVVRLEDGQSIQLVNLIRILRALGLLTNLEMLVPQVPVNPLDLLKLQGQKRQRASRKKISDPSAKKWTWGDER